MDELAEAICLIDIASPARCLGVLESCLPAEEATATGRAQKVVSGPVSRGLEMRDEASRLGEGGAVICESATTTT
jgi:hypothetical protein